MADGIELDAGSGGATVDADEIAGKYYPRSKIVIGADGTNDGDVSSANPLPVTGTITAVTDITNTVTVDLGTNNDVTLATLPDTAAGDLAAMVVDLAAIEVLLGTIDTDTGAMVTDLAAIEVLLTAANVDHAANEALLTTIDADTSAMAVDLAAIEVLLTAANVDHAANEALLTTIETNTDFGAVTGGGVEASALRVTIANNSTGVLTVDDGGSSLTVDGTVAATQSGAWNITNVSGTISLPTGAATAANQATGNASLATIAGDTTSLDGKVTTCNTGDVTIGAALPAGTNAIGKLTANSGVDIGDVDVTSIAAGTNTIGGVIAANQTDSAYDGTTSCTIKRKSGIAASGTTAILSAVLDKKFRILAFAAFATSATATNIYLATSTDTDVLGDSSNPIPVAVDADGDNVAGFVLPWNPGGWTETSTANEALNLVLSAAQDVIYAITYIEVA